jgi:putative methyltransferase (TIGR04325 family)
MPGAAQSMIEMLVKSAKSARSRFRGVYPDYATAEKAIPPDKLTGYDHAQLGKMYLSSMVQIRASDYPVLFWLQRILPGTTRVFDWGGNIGVSYFKFEALLDYPPGLEWTVCDLPEICKAGEEVCAERKAPVKFTTRFEDGQGADILMCIGALQYIPVSFSNVVGALNLKPKHILINRIPLWDGEDFVTLEDVSPAYCAYQVYNRNRFVESITKLGYELVDQWLTPDLSCNVRWHPAHSIPSQSGLYFRLK